MIPILKYFWEKIKYPYSFRVNVQKPEPELKPKTKQKIVGSSNSDKKAYIIRFLTSRDVDSEPRRK